MLLKGDSKTRAQGRWSSWQRSTFRSQVPPLSFLSLTTTWQRSATRWEEMAVPRLWPHTTTLIWSWLEKKNTALKNWKGSHLSRRSGAQPFIHSPSISDHPSLCWCNVCWRVCVASVVKGNYMEVHASQHLVEIAKIIYDYKWNHYNLIKLFSVFTSPVGCVSVQVENHSPEEEIICLPFYFANYMHLPSYLCQIYAPAITELSVPPIQLLPFWILNQGKR